MAYTLSYAFYCKQTGLCTKSKEKTFGDIFSLKEELDMMCYDIHVGKYVDIAPEGGKIIFSNGDEYAFQVCYNGKFCKKYSHGIK